MFLRPFRKHVTERFTLLETASNIWFRLTGRLLHIDGQDEISLASQVINQLLESKQLSSTALHDIEQKFAALYQNVAVGIIMVHDNQIVSMNDAAVRLFGYDQQSSPLGKPLTSLFPQHPSGALHPGTVRAVAEPGATDGRMGVHRQLRLAGALRAQRDRPGSYRPSRFWAADAARHHRYAWATKSKIKRLSL